MDSKPSVVDYVEPYPTTSDLGRSDNMHIHIVDVPPERGRGRRGSENGPPPLRRRSSSLSSRRVVPGDVMLPIMFRTLSVGIDENKSQHDKSSDSKEDLKPIDVDGFILPEYNTLPVWEVESQFSTSIETGLTGTQVEEHLKIYGPNRPSKPPRQFIRRFLTNCFGGFGLLLFIGGILCIISWKPLGQPPAASNLALSVVLFIVFLFSAFFNFWQDWSSARVMESIGSMIPAESLVLRGGQTQHVESLNLVPGDIVRIESGDKIPADLRMVQVSADLKFDQSILTGESKPIPASAEADDQNSNYLESKCIAMQGTYVVSGSGTGIVVTTGDETVFGHIAKMTSHPNTSMSPLQKEILQFIFVVLAIVFILMIATIIFWAAWLRKKHPSWISVPSLIVDIVSIAVSFIPEGLPIALTMSLIIVAAAMKRNNILCKSLSVVETLGSVSVICSDKTGTLTQNKMTVSNLAIDGQSFDKAEDAPKACVTHLHSASILCNGAKYVDGEPVGNATDKAAMLFADQISSVQEYLARWNIVYKLDFNSKNKFMGTLVEPVQVDEDLEDELEFDAGLEYLAYVKGAPDILLTKCSTFLDSNGEVQKMTMEGQAKITELQQQFSSTGQRVIVLCRKLLPKKDFLECGPSTGEKFAETFLEAISDDLTVIGLLAITDPLKEDIPYVISTLHGAGVRVFMVTGDYEVTAAAIAKDAGIVTTDYPDHFNNLAAATTNCEQTALVISGPDLNLLNDNHWSRLCQYQEIVFARTTPEQKLKIVKELQKREFKVGMTGDGVNDAPALKQADIGIAMGNGSEIAIEAADLVLLDSFSAIIQALKYGRLVFDNLKKTIVYLLSAGTYSELWPVLMNIFAGLPQILSSFLMIIICTSTDCFAAICLAYESPEMDILKRPPRSISKERLVDWKLLTQGYFICGTLECLCSMSMAYWYLQRNGIPFGDITLKYGSLPSHLDADYVAEKEHVASSIYFVTLVVMQFFNLFAVRTRFQSIFTHPPLFNKETRNIRLFFSIGFSIAVIFFFCYIPWFQKVILSTKVPVEYFFLPAAFGFAWLCIDELRKLVARRYPKSLIAKISW